MLGFFSCVSGILTSVLAKEGRLSSVSDAVGGTLKVSL